MIQPITNGRFVIIVEMTREHIMFISETVNSVKVFPTYDAANTWATTSRLCAGHVYSIINLDAL